MSSDWERNDAGEGRPGRARRDEDDFDAPGRKNNTAKTIVIVISVIGLVIFLGVATCVGLMIYTVNEVRKAATAAIQNAGLGIQDQNNYQQVALAMADYESQHNGFPPPAMKTKTGKPGLSWRVALLPHLGEEDLYSKFKLDEPWDSPTNRLLATEMPEIFASTLDPSPDHTHMRLIIGKGAIYEPNRVLRRIEITDGMSQTFLIVEATKSVLWTQPDELKFDPNGPLPELGVPGRDIFFAAMADGQVRRVHKNIAPEQIKAAITATGNEKVDLDQ